MNVNDSTYLTSALHSAQSVKKAEQQASIKPVESRVEKDNQSNNTAKDKSRFDVSAQAIALFDEQEQSNTSQLASTQEKNNTNQQANTPYDQPSKQNLSAVAAYESVDNIAHRENVKQFFGVNLFA